MRRVITRARTRDIWKLGFLYTYFTNYVLFFKLCSKYFPFKTFYAPQYIIEITYVIADTQRFRISFRNELYELFVLPEYRDVQGATANRILSYGQQFTTPIVLTQKILRAIHIVGANRGVYLFTLILLNIIVSDLQSVHNCMYIGAINCELQRTSASSLRVAFVARRFRAILPRNSESNEEIVW